MTYSRCFSIEFIDQPNNVVSIAHSTDQLDSLDYKKDRIVDLGCSHHATSKVNMLSEYDHIKESELTLQLIIHCILWQKKEI